MKKLVTELIREVADLIPPLAASKDLGSLRSYVDFLSRTIEAFADLLLTERQELQAIELTLLREMLDNPLLRPLAVTARIENELRRRGHL